MMQDNPDPERTDISPHEARWWESAEDHKFALEVLQLRLRRKILKFVGQEPKTIDEVGREFGLDMEQAKYHLEMLERGLVVERAGDEYRATLTGRLYLEKER